MKKLFALLISVMLCFCFVACTTTPANKSEVSSVITESETSSFASSDSDETSSEPTSSKSNSTSTSSKNNSTSSKNTTTSSNNVTTSSNNESNTTSKNIPSRPAASGTSSIKIPIEQWPGFKNNSDVKEEDKVTPIETSSNFVNTSSSNSKVKPMLYKVRGRNGATVYLFGSIHVGKNDMYPLPDYVINAYNSADALAVECYAETIDDELAAKLTQTMLYKDGSKITDHVSSKIYNAAKSIIQKDTNGYADVIDLLDNFKAIYWSSIIDDMILDRVGFESQYGVDNNLIQMAVDDNKQIVEIESVLEQYQMLGGFSYSLQEQLLYSSIYNYNYISKYKSSLTAMYNAWCNGDYTKLREYCSATGGSTAEQKEYNTKMSVNRDKKMAEFVIDKLGGEEDIFVCVGAAHIVGEGAIIDVLKNRGYTVERISK